MVETVTPSAITAGQIGKFQELLGARLRKSGLQSEPVQRVLASQGDAIADEMVAAVRRRVEVASNMIVCHVRVDRTRTPQQMLDATGRVQYTNQSVVDAMPRGEGEETDVFFFKSRPEAYQNGWISDEALDEEFEFHNLKPADPYSQAAVNGNDPAFANAHPNGTHWKGADGKWYFCAFDRWRGERDVSVNRDDRGWDDDWWFAGVCK